jgi:hypothetical protein
VTLPAAGPPDSIISVFGDVDAQHRRRCSRATQRRPEFASFLEV